MKNKLVIITIILLLLTTSTIPLSALGHETKLDSKKTKKLTQMSSVLGNNITLVYSFEPPTIKTIEKNGVLHDCIIMKDIQHYNENSETYLPVKPLRILLPQSKTVKKIKAEASNTKTFKVNNLKEIKAVTKTLDLNLNSSEDITNEDRLDSVELYKNLGVQYYRGFPVLHLNLYPLQYKNNTNMLYYHNQIKLTIETKTATGIYPMYRGLEKDKKEIIEIVDNSKIVQNYKLNGFLPQYDYVIITTNDLKPTIKSMLTENYTFHDLIKQRTKQGLSCRYKTIEDINKSYNGKDLQEKIRNFIKHAYKNWGTSWVLLGGDVEKIPIRNLYDIDGDDREIPSDLYYACLDGNYNNDNDLYWGEKNDGLDGGWIDLYAEVYIGRAPVDDKKDVSSFVEKTLHYENSRWDETGYLQNHLSVGEKLWNDDGGYGAGYVERCIDNCTDYNQITYGVPSSDYNVKRLYERDKNWDKNDFIYEINKGAGIINHAGHGKYNYLGDKEEKKFYIDDITELDNTGKYSLFYSQACHVGNLEKDDCFAEIWVNAEKTGGFAAIMNSGYGYGSRKDYDGPSNRYAREFFDAIFNENKTRIGKANQDSKEDNIWHINDTGNNMYHVYYQTNLFGDPFVQIKTSKNSDGKENEKLDIILKTMKVKRQLPIIKQLYQKILTLQKIIQQ